MQDNIICLQVLCKTQCKIQSLFYQTIQPTHIKQTSQNMLKIMKEAHIPWGPLFKKVLDLGKGRIEQRESGSQGLLKRNRTTHCSSKIETQNQAQRLIANQLNSSNECETSNLEVHSATAFPAPQNSASSSMPSSRHTVLSTSKHTALAFFHNSRTSTNLRWQPSTTET